MGATAAMIAFHPLANLFPLIEGQEFHELAEDIRANGLIDCIDLVRVDDGYQILDGRNRYRALVWLVSTGEVLGDSWGSWSGEALTAERVSNFDDMHLYREAPVESDADALAYVLSKNLNRRHLNDSQRASVAAKIANLGRGGDRSKPPYGGLSVGQAAENLNVSPRQVERARVVHSEGVPEVREALDRGDVPVAAAEKIARLPEQEQPAALEKFLPSGNRSIMSSRREPDGSLDYFPTPPWATRALFEHVLSGGPRRVELASSLAWEPACGEGHMAEVLGEYFAEVIASDIHDYGYGDHVVDFLVCEQLARKDDADWIITNPPFGDNSEAFVLKALDLAQLGVAVFVRLQWLESGGRYERIFRDNPPTQIAFFAERVNLCKGRWEPEGSTATAYIWLVWIKGQSPRPPLWIPPVCRAQLQRPDDAARFTQHPVARTPNSAAPSSHAAEPAAASLASATGEVAAETNSETVASVALATAAGAACSDEIPEAASGTAREAPSTLCEREPVGSDVGTQSAPPTLSEFAALKAISDFCYPRRVEILPEIAPAYIARGLAFTIGGSRDDWSLSDAGWKRLRELEAERRDAEIAERAHLNGAAGHPALDQDPLVPADQGKVSQPVDLVSVDTADTAVPPAERPGSNLPAPALPLDDDELALYRAMKAIIAGGTSELARDLVGRGYLHATPSRLFVTDEGAAWLRSIEDPPPPEPEQVDLEDLLPPAPEPIDLPLFLERTPA
jgi:hypothetical protein